MKQLAIAGIFLFFSLKAVAQPRWQQHVDTKIEVTLDDVHHFLYASEEIAYTNNSPDTLNFIYIHLWPNAYKNDHTPFENQQAINGGKGFYYSKPENRGYIDSLQFTVNNQSVDYNSTYDAPDIARIDLPQPLLPGGSIKIATPFRVKIPHVFSRMGHTGQAYYISQWFPKPAVYDQKGWHPISYLDQGEFFSEYGSYDVHITLPVNYVLMATGNCLDDQENRWLDSLANKPIPSDSEAAIHIPSAEEMKTVHYHEDNIHDFAWFADKRWVVRKDTVYSPGNNQLVTTWAAFLPGYKDSWKNATDYLKETIKHYGKWVGPYRYKTIKAVLGDMHAGGGMEYPTITIIDKSGSANLKTTIIHEGGHNWFYGMLGSMERDHAWMDEGINTFYEQKTTNDLKKEKDNRNGVTISLDENLIYYEYASTGLDQPIDQPSASFTKINYGVDVYYKTALMLRWLERYMGNDAFEKGMHDYYNTWCLHHPYPEDFRTCMERNTDKPIGWFFDTVLHMTRRVDFCITGAHENGSQTEVTVRNNSGIALPALVDAYIGDSLVASAWTLPFAGDTQIGLPATGWDKLMIDPVVPDAKRANNEYRQGAFHRFGLQLRPYAGLNTSYKDKIFISPSVGYNQYDGFLLGLLFHDLTLPENRFRFAVTPMYGFGSKSVNGAGSVGYAWFPSGIFREIMLQVDGKTFHDAETLVHLSSPEYAGYTKIAPSLTFTFHQPDPLSKVTRTLTLKEYNITEQNIAFPSALGVAMPDSLLKPALTSANNTYWLARYRHLNDRTYNPFNYTVEAQAGAYYAKLTAEGNVRIDYNVKNKSLYVRAFAGEFIPMNSNPALYSRYELNSTYSGVDDYLYDGTYFARNDMNSTLSHQVSMQEGGFKIPVFNAVDQSDSWMAALNLETDLPLKKLPIRLFFDAGLIPNSMPSITNSGGSSFIYDGGAEVRLIRDVVYIYVPFIMSSDFQNYLDNTYGHKNQFVRSLSFTFQLQNINWLKAPEGALKRALNN